MNDPAQMAKLMPGVEGFEIKDDRHWQAKVKVPLGLGGLRMTIDFEKLEERPPEFARVNAKGKGVGAMMNMTTSFTSPGGEGRRSMALGGRRQDRRPGRLDGPAGPAADRQPAGRERAHALEERRSRRRRRLPAQAARRRNVTRRRRRTRPIPRADVTTTDDRRLARGGAVPHRCDAAHDGAARGDARVRPCDGRGGDGHDLARRGVSVVAQARDGGARAPPSSRR